MRKLLLTQSQVSFAVSITVVIVFTLLLFLAGLVLQQQTIKGLQDELRPRIPQRPITATDKSDNDNPSQLSRSRFFAGKDGRVAYADFKRDIHVADEHINWQRLAHIQLVRDHHEVCNAIMVLAELHRMKSPARRVLLFPQSWAEEKKAEKGGISDPYLDSSRRLMRKAARRYHVELRPISPVSSIDDSEGEIKDVYSLSSAFALYSDFDRVLTIETPGMLLDAEPLDAVLAFTESTPFTMLHDTHDHDGVHSEDLLLLEPSASTFDELASRVANDTGLLSNSTAFSALFDDPLLLASSSNSSALIRSVSTLHDAPVDIDFNQTAFLSDVAYIRFWDPKLPGPQYDVPWSMKVAARPKSKMADWTWTNLYGQFAQKRMDICGLDLESWRP